MSLPQETTRKIKDLLFQRFKERHWDEYLVWHRQQAGSSQDVSTSSRHQSDSTPAEDAAVTNLIKGRFESCYRYLKRVPGGYSALQGSHGPSKDGSNWWDAGVAYEVRQYGPLLAAQDARYTNMAGMGSNTVVGEEEGFWIKLMAEEARAAHYRLCAPVKGFAALKGIPELQQLLAYTAADVVHYAAEGLGLGYAGTWRPFVAEPEMRDLDTFHTTLYDQNSLIGQLCPGLRLCLAAEVATGLICDSQPPPLDTPEHASALLLFLAAAQRQVEQECAPPELWPGGHSWRLDPSIPNCAPLVDLYSSPLAAAVVWALARPSDGSSSSSSNGSSNSSSSSSPALAVPQPSQVGGNVLLAAIDLARAVVANSEQPGSDESLCQQQERMQALSLLLQETVSLLDVFFAAHQQPTDAAAHPAAASAADQKCAAAGCLDSSGSSTSKVSAAEVAWRIAAVAGGAAWSLVLCGVTAARSNQSINKPLFVPSLAVQLALLATAVQGLQESTQAALDDWAVLAAQHDAAPTSSLQKQTQQQEQKQRLGAGLRASGSSQQRTDAARSRMKQDVLAQVLRVVDMGKAFQDTQGHTPADQEPLHTTTTSSSSSRASSSSNSAKGWDQRAQKALDLCRATFAAVQNAPYTVQSESEASRSARRTIRLLHMQLMNTLPTSPEHWFQHAFQLLGEEQLITACLQPQLWQQQQAGGSAAHPQQSTAGSDINAAVEQVLSDAPPPLAAAIWGSLRVKTGGGDDVGVQQSTAKHWLHRMETAYEEWQQAQLQLLSSAAPGSSHPGGIGSSSSSSSWPVAMGNTGGCAAAQPAQCASAAAATAAAVGDQLQSLVSEPGAFKELLGTVAPLVTWQSEWAISAAVLAESAQHRDWDWQVLCCLKMGEHCQKFVKDSKDGAGSDQQQQQEQQQQQKQKAGSAAGKKQKGRGKSAQEAATAAAHSKQADKHTGSAEDAWEKEEPERHSKPMDEVRRKLEAGCELCTAEQAAAAALSGSSSSSSAGGAPAAAGLYGALPVSWSDPFMMRRLLWDLLGKLKPTAQAWFRDHAYMCPHRSSAHEWHMVVMCLARHIWCPPGEWDEHAAQQVALLLQYKAREHGPQKQPDHETLARCSYAHSLNAAFVEQGADAQAAALLSLHALLALDPHGARVQPRPELLFYTPAGFHAAVCKTLMQATQPLPGLQCGQQQQQDRFQPVLGAHPLQAWTAAAFPAWHMWWHIGLLAYHQHQQGKADGKACCCHDSSASSSTASSSSASSSSGCGHKATGQGHTGQAVSGSCSACSSSSAVDLYSSPDARVFAVGYAARQISSRAELERLMNNPPVAAGLAVPPADWLAAGPRVTTCGQCEAQILQEEVGAVLCDMCWTWYCCQACYSQSCPHSCQADTYIKAKATRRWRLLDLLKPSLVPCTKQQPQQQRRQQQTKQQLVRAGPSERAEAVTASWLLHSVPQATGASLIDLCKGLLQQHEQRRRRGQQGLPQLPMDQEPPLLYSLHVKPAWDMCGTSANLLQRLEVKEFTLEQATRWEVPKRLRQGRTNTSSFDFRCREAWEDSDEGRWALLQRYQMFQWPPLQRHLHEQQLEKLVAEEQQRELDMDLERELDELRELEAIELDQHPASLSDEPEPPARFNARPRLRQQQGRQRAAAGQYGAHPKASTAAAAEGQGASDDDDGPRAVSDTSSDITWGQTGGGDLGCWDLDCGDELDFSFAETFSSLGTLGSASAADTWDPSQHPKGLQGLGELQQQPYGSAGVRNKQRRGLRELVEPQQQPCGAADGVGNMAYESLAASAADEGEEEEEEAVDSTGTPGVQTDAVTVLTHALGSPDSGAEEGLETFDSFDKEPCGTVDLPATVPQAAAVSSNCSLVQATQQPRSSSIRMSSSRQAGSRQVEATAAGLCAVRSRNNRKRIAVQLDEGSGSDSDSNGDSSAERLGRAIPGSDPGGDSSRMHAAATQSDVGDEMYRSHFEKAQGPPLGGPSRFSAID